MLRWILAVGMAVALPAMASAQNAENGANVFKKCKACHDAAADGKNKVGPNLFGIVGKAAGQVAGFNYSAAMKDSGKTWDAATLDGYLADPKGFIPGNKMVFVGIKDAKDAKDLVAYLAAQK